MSLAYILLQCDEGTEKEVVNKMKRMDGVKEAQETYGPYNIVVKIESDNPKEVKQIFNKKIHDLNGIRSTLTLLEEF